MAIHPIVVETFHKKKKNYVQVHDGGRGKVIKIHPPTSIQNFMAIHPLVVEICQSGLKWWYINKAICQHVMRSIPTVNYKLN